MAQPVVPSATAVQQLGAALGLTFDAAGAERLAAQLGDLLRDLGALDELQLDRFESALVFAPGAWEAPAPPEHPGATPVAPGDPPAGGRAAGVP